MDKARVYNAEPTPAEFHASDAFVRGLMGPVGSGKSVACCMEIISRAIRQRPNSAGVRKSRWAAVRNTYGELKTTTIKTWQAWIADSACPIVYDSPIRGVFSQKLADGTSIHLEILFIALDRPEHVKKLLSLELTGGWINECREVPKAILDGLTSRVGRYPDINDGGASWSGVIMDTNPPDDDHWYYRVAEEETPQDWKFFRQPPALLLTTNGYIPNPKAENICNLSKGFNYYLDMVPGKTGEWIKVYVQGQYGSVMEGKVVYPEYNDDLHSLEDIPQLQKLPLVIGFDFGLTPACVFVQFTPRGGINILDELVSAEMGIKQFMRDVVMPHINLHYKHFFDEGSIYVVGDPAGAQRSQADSEITCIETINSFGFKAETASSNSFLRRRETVASFLIRLSDGVPLFRLSRKCKQLRKGFLGGYKFIRVKVAGDERYKEQPDKNQYSHIHDALQYAAMYAGERELECGKFLKGKVDEQQIPTIYGM
ncbi:MAG: TerL [Pusillimonas sp.]